MRSQSSLRTNLSGSSICSYQNIFQNGRMGGVSRDEVQRNGRKLVFTFFLHVAHFARHRIVLINLVCSPLYCILFLALGVSLIYGIFIFLSYFEDI